MILFKLVFFFFFIKITEKNYAGHFRMKISEQNYINIPYNIWSLKYAIWPNPNGLVKKFEAFKLKIFSNFKTNISNRSCMYI